jgi:hypothetical protein
VHPEHQLDSVPAQGLAQRLGRCRLASKQAVGALDDHRLAAETPHDLRNLDAGGPATRATGSNRCPGQSRCGFDPWKLQRVGQIRRPAVPE